jgi:hypothetical protein
MDEALKAAARALRPTKALRLLREACAPSGWEFERVRRIEPVKHRPGRRLVLRYEVEARRQGERVRRLRVYAKLYRGRRGAAAYDIHQRLRALTPPHLCIPEPWGYSPRWRLLVLEALDGPTLADVLRDPVAPTHVSRFAAALATFHGLDPAGGTPPPSAPTAWRMHDARAECAVLDAALARMRTAPFWHRLAPAYADALQHVQQQLLDDAGPRQLGVIHRDLYAEQVFLLDGRVGVIDLDEVSLGERELDVGNVTAHLLLADLQQLGRIGPARMLVEELTRSYGRTQPLRPDRLIVYRSAALLRLASLERLGHATRSILDWEHVAGGLVAAVPAGPSTTGPPRPGVASPGR